MKDFEDAAHSKSHVMTYYRATQVPTKDTLYEASFGNIFYLYFIIHLFMKPVDSQAVVNAKAFRKQLCTYKTN